MSDEYKIIESSLNQKIKDALFQPELLGHLNDEERKKVEEELIKLCFQGERVAYQYIKYIKMYDIHEVFNDERMKGMDTLEQTLIYAKLFEYTREERYIAKLLELAKVNIDAYGYLALVYMLFDISNKERLYQELENLSNLSGEYKYIFENNCKVIPEGIDELRDEVRRLK